MKRKKESTSRIDKLTAAEMGKLWATYTGNSMAVRVLEYYLKHTEDEDIKRVVESAFNLSKSIVQDIKDIFIREDFPVPIGFTEEDVNTGAPRLFSDEFYLHYLKYTSKAGMSLYSIAIPIMTRKDIRDFYIHALNSTIKLVTEVNEVSAAKGFLVKPPFIPVPEEVKIVKQQKFLNGFLGDVRPLHALEVAHLYDSTENDATSKALLIGFSQVAKMEKVKDFFVRGKEITNKHIKTASQELNRDNLPAPQLVDDLVTASTSPPFSDKLMLWHKIDMFSMKIRSYANSMSLNGRRDIGAINAKFLMDIGLYLEDGANIMIDQGWMEQPPEAADRKELAKD